MGLNLAVLRPDRLQMQMCDTKFQSSLDSQGFYLQWWGPSRVPSGPPFRLVGSYTPFGFYKDTTIGVGCGRYLKHSSGLWEVPSGDSSRWGGSIFCGRRPLPSRRVAFETPECTSRDSNHDRQSVSAGKANAIPTEPSGRLAGGAGLTL